MDIAIDLGTSKTAVFVRGEGLVYEDLSVISLRSLRSGHKLMAIGKEAGQMRGREPRGVQTIRPLRGGVIEKLEAAKMMLREVARLTKTRRSIGRPNIVIGAPYRISDIERRAVREAATAFGAKSIYVVEEPIAAAIGAGIDISESVANMVVDVGSGISEVVVISLGGIVHSRSLRTGGDAISEALSSYIRNSCHLIVGEQTIDRIKVAVCDALENDEETIEVKGIDVHSRLPRTKSIRPSQARLACLAPINAIINTTKQVLESTPPMLCGDLVERGIVLTGGSALLKDFDRLLEKATGVPVRVAKDPLGATVRGVGAMLEEMKVLKETSANYAIGQI